MHRKADRRRAVQSARNFLEDNSVTAAPVDPFALATKLGIQLRAVNDPSIDFSGCLMREGRVWGIIYRDDIPNQAFKRFTVMHELGHFEMSYHHDALFATAELHMSQSNFTSHLWHEIEADTFAAEALMPEDQFRNAIRGTQIGFDAIRDLADRFETSLTSTAIRYAGLSPDPVAVIVSENGRIRYCFGSASLGRLRADWIEPGTPLPPSSLTSRSFREGATPGEARHGTSFLSAWFENPRTDIEFNEDVIDLGRYGRTLTVLHATEVPDEDEVARHDENAPEDSEAGKFNRDGKRVRW